MIADRIAAVAAEIPRAALAARVPRTRPDPSEDPETLANRVGAFVPQRMRRDDPITASISAEGDESVRTVGPVFGTSPEQDGVVITPVPN